MSLLDVIQSMPGTASATLQILSPTKERPFYMLQIRQGDNGKVCTICVNDEQAKLISEQLTTPIIEV